MLPESGHVLQFKLQAHQEHEEYKPHIGHLEDVAINSVD
jgi:hypothetical protein